MKNKDQNKEPINRRSFLKRAWTWLGIIAGIEVLGVSISMIASGKNKMDGSSNFVSAGFLNNIKPGSVTPFKNGQFYLVCLEDGGFLALSLHCTHLGCIVGFDASKMQFVCPCHSSSFDMVGNVIDPPAPRAMDAYKIIIEQGEVLVDIGRRITRQQFSTGDAVYA